MLNIMLDHETKRRIDSARDILVGKVPDPKSQVEQITIALIYKFMDDIDSISEQLGGRRSFFSQSFEKYAWAKLLRSGLGGHEMLNLYAEAVSTMTENHNLPTLFREIFKNAYLPYREPETLRQFLRIIDQFHYSQDYEKLGDAFEHLLSIMGAQGDAGQFRTPRHIIDFIVEIVNPRKDETVLDPACGTAGFLISAYKHILQQNADHNGIPGAALAINDRSRLVENIRGYDISPDMVRLSLVNLYLHQFQDPKIAEYDTLTHDDKWDERVNVILANPPFFSPKGGGIRPHSRFGVQSKRSEVLFVDYIASHLTSSGRAGVIVPEGILFQSQKAYKQLRKNLVEKHLAAVISLPAGVFNPYSGVKTSILILDRAIAGSSDTVAFFKIENDGFDLGAQRRPIDRDDLPAAKSQISEYLDRLRAGHTLDDFDPSLGLVVHKDKVRQDPDYNLSMERYREDVKQLTSYPYHEIGSLVKTITPSGKIPKTDFGENGKYPIIDQSQQDIAGWTDDESVLIHPDKPLVIFGDHTCIVKLIDFPFVQGADGIKILDTHDSIDPRFLYHFLRVNPLENTGYRRHFSKLREYQIPLPPLSLQREIVAEIQTYQSVIDGARQVVQNYKPQIHVDPQWEMVELKELCRLVRGVTYKKDAEVQSGGHQVLRANNITKDEAILDLSEIKLVSDKLDFNADKKLMKDDIFICLASGSKDHIGKVAFMTDDTDYYFGGFMGAIRVNPDLISPLYMFNSLRQRRFNDFLRLQISGANINNLGAKLLYRFEVPLPPLETQRALVADIQSEQNLVDASRQLIDRMETKIRAAVGRIWEE